MCQDSESEVELVCTPAPDSAAALASKFHQLPHQQQQPATHNDEPKKSNPPIDTLFLSAGVFAIPISRRHMAVIIIKARSRPRRWCACHEVV